MSLFLYSAHTVLCFQLSLAVTSPNSWKIDFLFYYKFSVSQRNSFEAFKYLVLFFF